MIIEDNLKKSGVSFSVTILDKKSEELIYYYYPGMEKTSQDISGFEKAVGEEFSSEDETRIRDEFSTFNRIMNGVLERFNFAVENCKSDDDFMTEYVCRKLHELNC